MKQHQKPRQLWLYALFTLLGAATFSFGSLYGLSHLTRVHFYPTLGLCFLVGSFFFFFFASQPLQSRAQRKEASLFSPIQKPPTDGQVPQSSPWLSLARGLTTQPPQPSSPPFPKSSLKNMETPLFWDLYMDALSTETRPPPIRPIRQVFPEPSVSFCERACPSPTKLELSRHKRPIQTTQQHDALSFLRSVALTHRALSSTSYLPLWPQEALDPPTQQE